MCMRLLVENVAKVMKAEIKLDGITVVAGYNSTGKSTISKCLVSIMSSFCNLENKINNEKYKEIHRKMDDWADRNIGDVPFETVFNGLRLISSAIITEYYEVGGITLKFICERLSNQFSLNYATLISSKIENGLSTLCEEINKILIRPKSEYVKFFTEREFIENFNKQINTINLNTRALVALENGSVRAMVSFFNNQLEQCIPSKNKMSEPIYIESKALLDDVNLSFSDFTIARNENNILKLIKKQRKATELTIDEYQENKDNTRTIKEILNETIKGHLVVEQGMHSFYDEGLNSNISIKSLASGLKNFVVIQTLIENGSLKKNGTLIIDEPEVNLHPEWQLKFAHLLVLMQKELNIKILLNTHSPYFVRAIQIFASKISTTDKCNYYYMKDNGENCDCIDVTKDVEHIYKALYAPLEQL